MSSRQDGPRPNRRARVRKHVRALQPLEFRLFAGDGGQTLPDHRRNGRIALGGRDTSSAMRLVIHGNCDILHASQYHCPRLAATPQRAFPDAALYPFPANGGGVTFWASSISLAT